MKYRKEYGVYNQNVKKTNPETSPSVSVKAQIDHFRVGKQKEKTREKACGTEKKGGGFSCGKWMTDERMQKADKIHMMLSPLDRINRSITYQLNCLCKKV
ncbi:hypothetical protein [Marasmitruncus massiliensis]|uniref:hypothetical protein n=1 Tax=Marasmitruncus massiliensis TaxID=1944642 RepID=UPI0011AEF93A|nr:hypothetical protein [Marasmitruncus massiliensis]